MKFKLVGVTTIVCYALLGGCTTPRGDLASIGPRPENYHAAVRTFVRSNFADPYTIRDAQISRPLPVSMFFDGITPIPHSGWMVCLRANAKNRMGAYVGQHLTGILFQNGVVATSLSDPSGSPLHQIAQHCADAAYEPFQIN
jgi:hypothetical protein